MSRQPRRDKRSLPAGHTVVADVKRRVILKCHRPFFLQRCIMATKFTVHGHALKRLHERFGYEGSWLIEQIAQGRFVWLKGAGDAGSIKKVRSGHLIYVPDKDEYCVVVMDDRSRLAITVLTEDMALKSSWANGITEATKLKAKKVSVGGVHDASFIHASATDRGELQVNVRVRTFSKDWKPSVLTLAKIAIGADAVDIQSNVCSLTNDQIAMISAVVICKISTEEMQPYGDFFVSSGKDKRVPVKFSLPGFSSLAVGEQVRRWQGGAKISPLPAK